MARTRKIADDLDVADRAIEEAVRLFAARGFASTSLQAVAEAVGVTKQALLYHFPGKEALREEVLERMMAHWKGVLPGLMARASSGEEMFDVAFQTIFEFFDADHDRARVLMREVLDRGDDLRLRIDEHMRPWTAVAASSIRRGQEQGRVRPEVDPEAYLVQVTALVIASISTAAGAAAQAPLAATVPVEPLVATRRNLAEMARIARTALFLDLPRPVE